MIVHAGHHWRRADQDEADAIVISGCVGGANYRAMDKATETDGAWDLSVTRNADRASPLIWQLFLDDRRIATARLYEYSRNRADKVKTLQIDFTTLQLVHYATTRSNTGDLWESFGIRYHEALVGSTYERKSQGAARVTPVGQLASFRSNRGKDHIFLKERVAVAVGRSTQPEIMRHGVRLNC